jgi:hypothetical protein
MLFVTVIALGVLPGCRGSEKRLEVPAVRPAANEVAAVTTAERLSEPVTTADPVAKSGLCLELVAPRARVVLGEPIVLVASLRNCSPKARTVPDLLAPEYGFLSTFVARPGEKGETRWESGVRGEGRGKRSRTLAPGEHFAAWIPIYADRRGWFLNSPGPYRVRAELALEGARLASNVVAFEVLPSPSDADRQAARTLMSPEVTRAFTLGAMPAGTAFSQLSAVVKEYPESRLAPYARLAMGVARTQRLYDPEKKSFKKPDCPAAVEDLRWSLERLEDPVFAATGTVALSECLEALGQKGAAQETFSSYYRRHPKAHQLPGVEDLFETRQLRSN